MFEYPSRLAAIALLLVALSPGCSKKSEPIPVAEVSEEMAPRVALAEKALDELKATLGGRLKSGLANGVGDAVAGCSKDAGPLTQKVASKHGLALGRSSHRLRNPANGARPWVAQWLQKNSAGGWKPGKTVVYDLGNKLGVLRPIPTADKCLLCHGSPATLSAPIKAELAKSYPNDKATGFAVGDLRGVFWAEVSKK